MKSTSSLPGRFTTLMMISLIAACSSNGKSNDSSDKGIQIERLNRVNLMTKMEQIADSGKGFSVKDATSMDRNIYLGNPGGYFACFKKEVPEMQAVELYVISAREGCPDRPGAKVPTPTAPNLLGKKVEESYREAMMAGYSPRLLKVSSLDNPEKFIDPKIVADWQVCGQSPSVSARFDANETVQIRVAKKCP